MLLFLVPKGNPELLELLSLHWIIDIFRTTIVSNDDDKDDDDDDDKAVLQITAYEIFYMSCKSLIQ